MSASCLPSSRNNLYLYLYEKKLNIRGYGEKNMLITGTSAARRPKVGGGGGASKLSASAAWRDRRRALVETKDDDKKAS